MIQLAVQANNGTPGARRYLDLYDTDPIKLTLSIEDITTTNVTAVYSQTFRIPATGNNSAFFITAFDINGFDFNIAEKQPAELIVDGDIYQSGEIRLLKVFIDDNSNSVDYQIVFLGTTRSFASSIGETNLCELDLTSLSHVKNSANVINSWNAYPNTAAPGGLNLGLLSGDIVYPIVDFGNTYDSSLNPEQTLIRNGGSANNWTQNNVSGRLNTDRLRPCIRAKVIWDKIFENAGFTYESQFLDSNLFRHLYVGGWGDDASVEPNFSVIGRPEETYGINGTGVQVVPVDAASNDGFDFTNNWFDINATAVYDIVSQLSINTSWIDPDDPGQKDATYRVNIYKNTIAPANLLATSDTEVLSTQGVANTTAIIGLSADNVSLALGDNIFRTIELIADNDWGGAYYNWWNCPFTITQDASANPGISLSCKYKQLDFIKDIISKFRLVMAPDRSIPDKFIIEPWVNYIGAGEQLDWTSKMDLSKDIQVSPTLYTQKEKIKFEDKDGEDFLNVLNQTDIGEVYGTLNYDSQQSLLKDERKVETKFEPLPSTQIGGTDTGTNGMFNTIIPQIHDQVAEVNSSGNTVVLRNPCKPGVRLFWYDGLKQTGISAANDNNWYLTDGAFNTSHTTFPMISQFSEWGDYTDSFQGLDTLTQDINWQRENTYIRGGLAQPELANSVYDNYWANYVFGLYDTFGRRVTLYLRLDKFDLLNFSFDDAIFLKNGWYYIEKINSVDLTKEQSVKVELIRLNNFTVGAKDFIPPGDLPQEWQDITDNWEAITTNWENV